MEYAKLQAGCLLIFFYILWMYWKESVNTKIECNFFYDALLCVAPWAIFFDGLTAWTVNHTQIVSDNLNLALHGLFFISMDLTIIFSTLYMWQITVGVPREKGKLIALLTPSVLSIVGILVFLKDLFYIEGTITRYSMGISVIICYLSLVVHFGMIFALILFKHRTIEKHKRTSILVCVLIAVCVLIYQMIQPEALVSAIFPVMMVLGLYINSEDPAKIRLEHYHMEVVSSFATLVENRDDSTGNHIKRTRGYVGIILDEMRRDAAYRTMITKDYIENVLNAAPMHDIGKIAIPDSILQKPGKLTEDEFDLMKTHTILGGNIILETFRNLDEPEYLKIAYETARFHHEKWNGKGYPDGLAGEEIPLHARMMAIADVFDALSAKRCYRDALPLDDCFRIIEQGIGSDFDPQLATLFLCAKERVVMQFIQNTTPSLRQNKKGKKTASRQSAPHLDNR